MNATAARSLRLLATIAIAGLITACSGAAPSASPAASGPAGDCPTSSAPAKIDGWNAKATATALVPTLISSQQVCGRNRLMFGFSTTATDSSGKPVAVSAGSPDLKASVAFYDLAKDPNTPAMSADATFLWAIEGKTGVYVVDVTYPQAGEWGAEFTTSLKGSAPQSIRVRYQVQAEGLMPGIGDAVPSVKTPTAADVGGDLKQISTDQHPDPRFYQTSEDQALTQHKPFVLVFATPAFCTSQICGPTLDKIKAMAADFPDMTFINVEPYKMQYTGGHLQPVVANNQLQPNDASTAFNLLSEPWVYVVDGNGKVTGSFEAVAGPEELKAAIAATARR